MASDEIKVIRLLLEQSTMVSPKHGEVNAAEVFVFLAAKMNLKAFAPVDNLVDVVMKEYGFHRKSKAAVYGKLMKPLVDYGLVDSF